MAPGGSGGWFPANQTCRGLSGAGRGSVGVSPTTGPQSGQTGRAAPACRSQHARRGAASRRQWLMYLLPEFRLTGRCRRGMPYTAGFFSRFFSQRNRASSHFNRWVQLRRCLPTSRYSGTSHSACHSPQRGAASVFHSHGIMASSCTSSPKGRFTISNPEPRIPVKSGASTCNNSR